MPVTSIFHVGFSVRDIEASIRFYEEGLGLRLRHQQIQDNEYTCSLVGYDNAVLHVAQFQLPAGDPPPSGHVLELIQYERPPGGEADRERNTIGAGHLAFAVDDIEEMASRLVEYGATLINKPVEITAGINRGGRAVYLFDPDGVTLELLQQAAP
jgi:lactoylglutathione lyase